MLAQGVSPGSSGAIEVLAPEGRQRAALGVSPARKRRTDCRPFRAQRPLGAPLPDGLRHRLPSAAPSGGLTTHGRKLRRIGIWGAGREWVEPGEGKRSRRSWTLSGLLPGGHSRMWTMHSFLGEAPRGRAAVWRPREACRPEGPLSAVSGLLSWVGATVQQRPHPQTPLPASTTPPQRERGERQGGGVMRRYRTDHG
jgi:hypothetical protein